MKAVILTGGKQYLVSEGDVIYVEKLDNESGSEVIFQSIMLIGDKKGTNIANTKVIGKIVKHGKQKKIRVFKYNPKKKYRKTQGHRQPYTKVEITKIEG